MLHKIIYTIQFIGFYFFQLLRSNIYLARLTLKPKLDIRYGFIEIPLSLKSNFGILLFSNLVSMTPGSLVTDISKDRSRVTVHAIFPSSEHELLLELQNMQTKIKNFTE